MKTSAKVAIALYALLMLIMVAHIHTDITAIQYKLGILDKRGRILPAWHPDRLKEIANVQR